MSFSPQLIALGNYLAGLFDNRQQALAEPIWYVHLHLWLRPVPLFGNDSLTLYAEQANIVNLENPYRPRLLRLKATNEANLLQVDFYMFKDIQAIRGGGRKPELLQKLSEDAVEFLPGCSLKVQVDSLNDGYNFQATSINDCPCSFAYDGKTYQVALGFTVNSQELLMYDKGIDITTGKGIWGALMGPFRFEKRQDFAGEFPFSHQQCPTLDLL